MCSYLQGRNWPSFTCCGSLGDLVHFFLHRKVHTDPSNAQTCGGCRSCNFAVAFYELQCMFLKCLWVIMRDHALTSHLAHHIQPNWRIQCPILFVLGNQATLGACTKSQVTPGLWCCFFSIPFSPSLSNFSTNSLLQNNLWVGGFLV